MVSKAEDGAIRLTCFNPNESTKLKLTFNLGSVDHPVYGSSEHLGGEFQFLNNKGSYQIPNYFELSKDEQDKILQASIKRLRHLYPEDSDEDIQTKFFLLLLSSILIRPRIDIHSKESDICMNMHSVVFQMDDGIEDHELFEDLSHMTRMLVAKPLHWSKFYEPNSEKPAWFKAVPNLYEGGDVAASLMQSILNDMRALYPDDMPNGFKAFHDQLMLGFQACVIGQKAQGPLALSEDSLSLVRGYDSGAGIFVEIFAALQGYSVPENIRESLLFQLLLKTVREFSGLSNDIIGIWRDIKKQEVVTNVILRRVVREGVPIQKSFDEAVKRLQNIVADMKIVMIRLRDAFPEEKGLAGFIQTAKDVSDGQALGYLLSSKIYSHYGPMTLALVPDE